LGLLYYVQGRYAEAELLYKRSLGIREKVLGPHHPDTAQSLGGLGGLYRKQGRYAEAEPLLARALAIQEQARGPEHPAVASTLRLLSRVCRDQGRLAEAGQFAQRALQIHEKAFGPEHSETAWSLTVLADLRGKQKQYAEAEKLYERAIAVFTKTLGPNHASLADPWAGLTDLCIEQGRWAEAEPLADRVLTILEQSRVASGLRWRAYYRRAQISWKLGHKADAVTDLREAIDAAEQYRGQTSGTEHERAEAFLPLAEVFERMVVWQLELGDAAEALSAIERSHARSLLDELGMGGADLNLGRTALEREQLRQREAEVRARLAGLEKQLAQPEKLPADQRSRLEAELAEARAALYHHYRDQRRSSPVYRNLLSVGAGPPRLRQIQRPLGPQQCLLLGYMLGDEGGYLVVVHPDAIRLASLTVDKDAAKTRGIDPGPLVAKRLKAALANEAGTGVLQQLADPKKAGAAIPKLAALWQLLVPEPERKERTGGRFKRLAVVPDGPLALLPFETLVVSARKGPHGGPYENPRYLLDAGPPISYGPSATVLYSLAQRQAATPQADVEPVLTVGNPNWLVDDEAAASLIGSFCSGLAAAEKEGTMSDYAAALHAAKRWVRDQQKWGNPYYWGTFVLVGPN